MLDETDLQILEKLQQPPPKSQPSTPPKGKKSPAPITHAAIAEQINQELAQDGEHVSESKVTRHIEDLAEDEIFTGYTPVLDVERLGFAITVLMQVKIKGGVPKREEAFKEDIKQHAHVLHCWKVADKGMDYLLLIVVPDVAALDHVVKEIRQKPGLKQTATMLVLEHVKHSTILPPLTHLHEAIKKQRGKRRHASEPHHRNGTAQGVESLPTATQ